MIASPPFALLRERIVKELERYRGECEMRDGVGLHRSQGAVAALRVMLALPATMLKEMDKPAG